eukprot:CAMPEP_0184687436 /NCGR_PEP_ID=MMETSP0312-20130426/26343_1 /TAXON_ID=31354 /ORGANISM="Compsopogon coeruleus, Strain SAG 36.94" /LENGTH=82 /DNA_ID=CAMNT_0027143563 /DNA_START=42 /DNA_END=286 /DNA_ORIENTATION=+
MEDFLLFSCGKMEPAIQAGSKQNHAVLHRTPPRRMSIRSSTPSRTTWRQIHHAHGSSSDGALSREKGPGAPVDMVDSYWSDG